MSVPSSGAASRRGVTMDHRLQMIGTHVTRYGLVLILLWIGGMKFTAYEAEGIRPFVENSPLFAWYVPGLRHPGAVEHSGGDRDRPGLLIALPPVGRRVRPWAAGWPSGCS